MVVWCSSWDVRVIRKWFFEGEREETRVVNRDEQRASVPNSSDAFCVPMIIIGVIVSFEGGVPFALNSGDVKQSTCCELAIWKCEVRDVKQSTCVVSWRAGNANGR